jgi:hypothetical protein
VEREQRDVGGQLVRCERRLGVIEQVPLHDPPTLHR